MYKHKLSILKITTLTILLIVNSYFFSQGKTIIPDYNSVLYSESHLSSWSLSPVLTYYNFTSDLVWKVENFESKNDSPVISNIAIDPINPTSTDAVTISADINDNGSVASASLSWGLTSEDYSEGTITMTEGTAPNYVADATIAAQAEATTVYYIITATDNESITTTTDEQTYYISRTNASVTSSEYTVAEGTPGSISDIQYGTDLVTFKSNITAPPGGTFEVYESDGTTPATDLATGYILTGTAEDGTTTADYTITVSDIVPDEDSDVTAPTTQVPAATVVVVDVDEIAEAFDAFSFDINDAGSADGLDTKVDQIVLYYGPNMTMDLNSDDIIESWFNVGGSRVDFAGEPIIGEDSIAFVFNKGDITIPDGNSVNVILKLVLNPNATEGKVFQVMIPAANHGFESIGISSEFAETFSAQITGNNITIDVVATELIFSTEPTNVYVDANITPAVVVEAIDANGNVDTDYTENVTISSSASTATLGGTITVTAVNGVATFSDLTFDAAEDNVTLSVTDGTLNGGPSAAINITEEPEKDLFFSEYIEGSGYNKAIEIYNPTNSNVDLSTYAVKQSHNATGWGTAGIAYVLNLQGTLRAGDVYVIAANTTNVDIILVADTIFDYSDEQGHKIPYFNGNDALGLFNNDELIDVIGNELEDSVWSVAGTNSATEDNTISRKYGTIIGNTNWTESAGTNDNDSEWKVDTLDHLINLGYPSYNPSEANITDFNFETNILIEDPIIDTNAATVSVTTIFGTDLSNQTAVPELSTGASTTDSYTDFTSPVTYTIEAEDGTTKIWTVTCTVSATQSSEAEITSVTVDEAESIDISSINATVTVNVAYNFGLAAVQPTFEISAGAAISDTTQAYNFSTNQTYTVTAQDGTDKVWTVSFVKPEPTKYTIYAIQYTTDVSGDSPHVGEFVKTSGVVTAAHSGGYFIQDEAAAWHGLFINDYDNEPSVGDSVEIAGKVGEVEDHTELSDITGYEVLNTGLDIFDPIEVSTLDAGEEQYEGVLVKVTEAECTAEPDQYNVWSVNDGSGAVNVDDNMYEYTPTLEAIYDIVGIMHGWYGTVLLPRSADDINTYPEISDITIDPTTPTSADDVDLSVTITDAETDVQDLTAQLFYGSAQGSEDTEVTDFAYSGSDDIFEGTIPASSDDVYYKVVVTDASATVTATGSYSVATTGVINPDGMVSMNIFPNPSNGLFTLEMKSSKAGSFNVQIINIQGQVVYNKEVNQNGFYQDQIDISNEASGIYYIRINDGKNTKVSKIMIQ